MKREEYENGEIRLVIDTFADSERFYIGDHFASIELRDRAEVQQLTDLLVALTQSWEAHEGL